MREKESRKASAIRLANVLRMVYRMGSRRGLSTKETVEEFDICERTFRRYMNAIEAAGVPYYFDAADKVYRTRGGWRPDDLG